MVLEEGNGVTKNEREDLIVNKSFYIELEKSKKLKP